jgi:hypothetical protein
MTHKPIWLRMSVDVDEAELNISEQLHHVQWRLALQGEAVRMALLARKVGIMMQAVSIIRLSYAFI